MKNKNQQQLRLLGITFLLLSSCGQNSSISLSPPTSPITGPTAVNLSLGISFRQTKNQNDSLPDLSFSASAASGSSFPSSVLYRYSYSTTAGGTDVIGWTDIGTAGTATSGSVGPGIEGLAPGTYYVNVQAIDTSTNQAVGTQSVSFVVLPANSTLPTVNVSGPAGGSSATSGGSETITGSCSPIGSTVTVSGAGVASSASGTCTAGSGGAGVFSVPVTLASVGASGGSLPITTTITSGSDTTTGEVVLNVPPASNPVSVAITGPTSFSGDMTGLSGANALTLSCTVGSSVNLSGEINLSTVAPSLPVACTTGTITFTNVDFIDNAASDPSGIRHIAVTASMGSSTASDSGSFIRLPGAATITSPATSATVGLSNTASGTCAAGDTVSISNSRLSPNPTTGPCASDGTYSIPITFLAATSGSQVLSVTQIDSLGNASAATTRTVSVDSAAPTATLSIASSPTNSSPISVTVTLSEAMTGLTASDFVVSNGTVGALSGGPLNYTLSVAPTTAGNVTVDLPASVATDAQGNANAAAAQLALTYDNVAPAIALTSGTANGSFVNSAVTVTLNASNGSGGLAETITGLSNGDFTCTNCTVSVSGSGSSYTVTVTPTASGAFSVLLPASTVADAAGNNNTVSNTLNWSYDHTAPTATLSVASSPTNASPISVIVILSEPVTGLTASDFVIGNGTVGALTGGPTSYSLSVTPTATGTVTVDLPAASAVDSTGNANTAATQLAVSYDNSAPSMTLAAGTGAPASGSATNVSSIPATITASESVTGLIASDLNCTNCTISAFSGSGASYSFNVVPTAAGTVSVQLPATSAQDSAGNNNTASNSLSWTYDNVVPTVTLTSIAGNSTHSAPIPIKLVWSERITTATLSESDFTTSNASINSGSLSCTNLPALSPTHTECTLTLIPAADGNVTISLASNRATDIAGNGNDASTPLTIAYSVIIAQIYSGYTHSCAYKSNGSVYCWGDDTLGALGDGGDLSDTNQASPTAVLMSALPSGSFFQSLAKGWGNVLSCGVLTTGNPACWGINADGQNGSNTPITNTRIAQPILLDVPSLSSNDSIIQTVTGGWGGCLLSNEGRVFCWGGNTQFGTLGNSTSTGTPSPAPTEIIYSALASGETFKSLSAGAYNFCGLSSLNKLYCWGLNQFSILDASGVDFSIPTLIDTTALGSDHFKSVYLGRNTACGISSSDHAYCWGLNSSNQVGDGNANTSDRSITLVDETGLQSGEHFASAIPSYSHTCGVTNMGNGFCWGSNNYGELGSSVVGPAISPMPIDISMLGPGFTWSSIAPGRYHSCAIGSNTTTPKVYCWGRDNKGQLGNGDVLTSNLSAPSEVTAF